MVAVAGLCSIYSRETRLSCLMSLRPGRLASAGGPGGRWHWWQRGGGGGGGGGGCGQRRRR